MPVTIKTFQTYEKKWEVSWEFEADLKDSKLDLKSEPLDFGLPGTWALGAQHGDTPETRVRFVLRWELSVMGAVGPPGASEVTAALFALSNGPPKLVMERTSACSEGHFPMYINGKICLLDIPEEKLKELGFFSSPKRWRLDVTLNTSDLAVVERPMTRVIARHMHLLASSSSPSTVRFVFPKYNFEVWSTKKLLSNVSPYFATLLSSGFKETAPSSTLLPPSETLPSPAAPAIEPVKSLKKRRRWFLWKGPPSTAVKPPLASTKPTEPSTSRDEPADTSPPVAEPSVDLLTFDDSDDEVDELYDELGFAPLAPSDADEEEDCREVVIRSTACATYFALITWLNTGHLEFAPLRSSFRSGGASSTNTLSRRQQLAAYHAKYPFLPVPVSPKSMYRLAHLLEMPQLQSLALASFQSQLAKECVAYELVSDVAGCYDELRNVVVEFVAEHFSFVKTSEAMKSVKEAMKEDEVLVSRFATVMGELMEQELK